MADPLLVGVVDVVPLGVADTLVVADSLLDVEALSEPLRDTLSVCVPLALADAVRLADPVNVADALLLAVPLALTDSEGVFEDVFEAVGDKDRVKDGDTEADRLRLRVAEAVRLTEVLALPVADRAAELLEEALRESVAVSVPDAETVADWKMVDVMDLHSVRESLFDGVLDFVLVKEVVGELLRVDESDCVEEDEIVELELMLFEVDRERT